MGTVASPVAGPPRAGSVVGQLAEFRRVVDQLEAAGEPAKYLNALKAFLAFAEAHRKELDAAGPESAQSMDEVAMAFYRASQPELAARACEIGLTLAPGSARLLHHKALILLAENRNVEETLPLLDRAIEANPHDKSIWATRGDALKLLGRSPEAAESYLRAQELDATSTQFVDRALKLIPNHPKALRLKLQLAKAHGGDRQALAACEALLATSPGDPELLVARAELLTNLGELAGALAAIEKARAKLLTDSRRALLHSRILILLGREAEAIPVVRGVLEGSESVEPGALEDLAETLEENERDLSLALAARLRLKTVDPRNLANLTALRLLAERLDRLDEALEACRTVLAAYPENLEAMRGVAELLLAQGKSDEAFEAYRALVKAHPHDVAEHHRALEAAKEAGRSDLVREFAEAILAEEPSDAGALENLAFIHAKEGRRPEAIQIYDQLLAQSPTEVRYLLEKKQLLVELNDAEQLRVVYDEIFRLDPTRSDIAVERGNLNLSNAYGYAEGSAEREASARAALVSYERSSTDPALAPVSLLGVARASRLVGDHERSVTAYRNFLVTPGQERRTDVLKELGHALRETGRYTEADEVYSRAIGLGLEDPDLFWGEVEVLSVLNHEARALRLLDLLLQREPTNPLFLRRKGQMLLKMGHRAEGLQALKSAVQGAQGDPHLHFEAAEALREQGAYADAVGYYRQGLEVDPKSRAGRLALAETLVLAGQYHEAVPLVDALLKEDANDLAAWKTRGDAYRALGRTSELLYSLTAILLLDPNNAAALLEKFRLHQAAGAKADAYEVLSQLLDGGGPEANDASLHLERGDLAAQLGRTDDANRAYEKAADLDPSHVIEIASRRARLRLTAGRPDLALEVLDVALKSAPAGGETSVSGLILRAEILVALERPSEARAVYESVLTAEPRSPVALAGVARALLDEGKHAEAKEFLRGAIPKVPASPTLYLLTAEAESGLGNLPAAIEAVKTGVEALPKQASLWVRLGELYIAMDRWAEASNAFAHAIAIEPENVESHLRAGFVAEKLGHPNEALALYDRATQVQPNNKYAWCSRGLALMATGRPDDARASFDRALALDADLDAAKEGRKAALQRTREGQIEKFGKEALLLEARLNRPVTKNDLFVTMHVPYDLLEPVLTAVGRNPRIDVERLSEAELRDLETASYHLVTAALDRRPAGIERRGFTLADVAVLSPATYSLGQVQQLFGYLKAVLEADLRPENLQLTPDIEELARKALLLPEPQRTLFQLVRILRVGIFKARLIKVVESAGSAMHAPLPSLDLGAYSPEFRPTGESGGETETYFAPENVPAHGMGGEIGPSSTVVATPEVMASPTRGTPTIAARCVGCGGLASVVHACGAPICQHCIGRFLTCPKCQQPVTTATSRPVEGVVATTATARPSATKSVGLSLKSVFQRARPGAKKEPTPPTHGKTPPRTPPSTTAAKAPPAETPPAPTLPESSPRPARTRERTDDEPRL